MLDFCQIIIILLIYKNQKSRKTQEARKCLQKEKKSKGLFYLIFTLTIIAALTISCKNKPTGSNDFAGFDENMALNGSTLTKDDFTKFIGKTIRSRAPISGGIGYFWAEFSADGIKFGQGDSENKGSLPEDAQLNLDALADNKANFKADNNKGGSIKFELDADNKITDIIVTISSGASPDIIAAMKSGVKCQFVN